MAKAILESENQQILKRYRNLLRLWKPKNPEDRKIVRKAFRLALEAHRDMRRKSGEPYIFHPLGVATICVEEIGLGTTSVVCALLHDVVEDTEYSLEDIRGLFGEKVASIIDALTKIKGIFDQSTTSIHAENFKRLLLTLSDDVRVILIKLADRLHNMRTLDALPAEKQLKISSETTILYAPLAHRLGLHAIKSELEDLALKYTEPEIYKTLVGKIRSSARERSRFVSKFIFPIRKDLIQQDFKFTIKAREKSIAAIWQKMKKKEVPFEEIYDIFAIRIVIDTPIESEKSDCWKVYSIVTDYYLPNMDRLRDWISIPKANGYEALHTTVMGHTGHWVEIQIRSKRMDEVAERGYAAHWKYKESFNISSKLDNWLDRIKEMIESPDADAISFIDDVKGFFFLDEISVFTPSGEMRILPASSTVLDFAYAIHSEIGNNCIGAKVDKKLVPINHPLKNGQQVEVITSNKQMPKEEWLTYVVTTRAKSNIKQAIKEEKRNFSKPGREKLEKWFKEFSVDFKPQQIKQFQTINNFPTLVDLYYSVATDKIGLKDVKIFAASNYRNGWINYVSRSVKKNKEILPHEADSRFMDQDESEFNFVEENIQGDVARFGYQVSACCNPIPGDEAIGLIPSEKSPMMIHRTNCAKALDMISQDGTRFVKLNWTNNEFISFLTGIRISGIDKKGLINEITRIISNELNLNIQAFTIQAENGITEGQIRLFVRDNSTLNKVLEKLADIEGVTSVRRVD
ncbi:MAG: RelA/SpoT family protein [Bacteroidetes bacterium]|nr:RelA/SpoT family protein [Bacteroidota bacterium]